MNETMAGTRPVNRSACQCRSRRPNWPRVGVIRRGGQSESPGHPRFGLPTFRHRPVQCTKAEYQQDFR